MEQFVHFISGYAAYIGWARFMGTGFVLMG